LKNGRQVQLLHQADLRLLNPPDLVRVDWHC
jgi:hypothetical protein